MQCLFSFSSDLISFLNNLDVRPSFLPPSTSSHLPFRNECLRLLLSFHFSCFLFYTFSRFLLLSSTLFFIFFVSFVFVLVPTPTSELYTFAPIAYVASPQHTPSLFTTQADHFLVVHLFWLLLRRLIVHIIFCVFLSKCVTFSPTSHL